MVAKAHVITKKQTVKSSVTPGLRVQVEALPNEHMASSSRSTRGPTAESKSRRASCCEEAKPTAEPLPKPTEERTGGKRDRKG